jgi:hypothetical protein
MCSLQSNNRLVVVQIFNKNWLLDKRKVDKGSILMKKHFMSSLCLLKLHVFPGSLCETAKDIYHEMKLIPGAFILDDRAIAFARFTRAGR